MKKRHYITSIFVLVLPVIVIFALTSYDTESAVSEQEKTMEIKTELKQQCQKKGKHQQKAFS